MVFVRDMPPAADTTAIRRRLILAAAAVFALAGLRECVAARGEVRRCPQGIISIGIYEADAGSGSFACRICRNGN